MEKCGYFSHCPYAQLIGEYVESVELSIRFAFGDSCHTRNEGCPTKRFLDSGAIEIPAFRIAKAQELKRRLDEEQKKEGIVY